MATYKVLQDIEAEDKLVGPLSLRQFIYAMASAVSLYICFLGLSKGAAFLVVLFLPVGLIGGFFAFPWKGEQPTEIWALARLRFMIKPRVRIWNQSGIKEIVTVTAPKNIDDGKPKTRNLSQTEVRSRLKALADTIDSRGWATRNVNFRYYSNAQNGTEDRLVNASDLKPGSIPLDAFSPANDMLDGRSQIAQIIDQKLNQGMANQRQQAQAYAAGFAAANQQPIQRPMQQPALQPSYNPVQQLQQPTAPAPTLQPVSQSVQQPVASPQALSIQAQPTQNNPAPTAPAIGAPQSMPQLPVPVATPIAATSSAPTADSWFTSDVMATAAPRPIAMQSTNATTVPPIATAPATPTEPVTRPTDPAILKLANNNDLNVATIARQAQKEVKRHDGEVEVSLR